MGYFSMLVNFLLGRNTDWQPTSDLGQMRRWNDRRWEYRDPTPGEFEDAYAWWAVK